ncbi:MAG TPA: 3-hydroxyacyl-CoA dehydrogenase NAD-binding domain-containing protein [Gemmataceae bacterium]|jgi:3-hydroxybutyryl-CoA dehydrogenase|nr:3-hydroxyacyl-CoA dehydrogenase NAD-binding domain-containing protein [Gemmataceae bacterium]
MSRNFETIGVVGTGQMGAGIAQVAAAAGHQVFIADMNVDLAVHAKNGIAQRLSILADKGTLTKPAANEILSRLLPAASVHDLKKAGTVIEAVSENVELKLRLFRELDAAVNPEAILASNTSSISITLLAAATKRPDRVMGMHFMNPVPIMTLVELIRGLQTSDETFSAVKGLAEKWGKTTTVAKDYPGFIVNRLLIPFLNEACNALMNGVGTVEDIDKSIKLGLNHPMGPFQLADLIGLDTVLAIARVLHEGLGDSKYRPSPLLVKYVEAGWFGRKTGRGFHAYK